MRRAWWGLIAVVVAAAVSVGWWQTRSPAAEVADPTRPPAVLLIPGYGGGTEALLPLEAELTSDGYDVDILDVGDGTDDLRTYADLALAAAADYRSGGTDDVSVIGFSAGGITARIAATEDSEAFDHVITLASPHQGTTWAIFGGASCPPACRQLVPGSELLTSLPPAPDAQTWLSLYSTTDEIILPSTSSQLTGATDLPIQQVCPSARVRHGQVPTNEFTVSAVTAFLAGQSLPSSCPLP